MFVPPVLNTVEPSVCVLGGGGGAFELTHGSACIIGWCSGLLDILIPASFIAHFMGCVIGRIYNGLKVVFCLDILLPTIIIIVPE